MKQIKIKLEGTTPLICNRFTDEAQQSVSSGKTSSTLGSKGTPKEQDEKKLYPSIQSNGSVVPIIPSPNLFRCLIDSGKFFKNGKSKVTTLKSSMIPAVAEVEGIDNPVEIPIESKEGWMVDTRAVRIPSTGGRVLAHRPCFNDWSLTFLMRWDDSEMDERFMRELWDAAGKKIGLGDFRPDCKGPYGKFVVVNWEVEVE